MQINRTNKDDQAVFLLSGRFLFSDHEQFRRIVDVIKAKEAKNVQLDLSNLEFVDSAALGMFLVAREEAGKNEVGLTIKGPSGHVKKIFDMSNFSKMFSIVG